MISTLLINSQNKMLALKTTHSWRDGTKIHFRCSLLSSEDSTPSCSARTKTDFRCWLLSSEDSIFLRRWNESRLSLFIAIFWRRHILATRWLSQYDGICNKTAFAIRRHSCDKKAFLQLSVCRLLLQNTTCKDSFLKMWWRNDTHSLNLHWEETVNER